MSKIVSLNGDPLPTKFGEPDSACIEVLEKLLAQARSGELVGVVVAMQYRDRRTGYQWGGWMSRATIGALEICKAALCKGDMEDDQ